MSEGQPFVSEFRLRSSVLTLPESPGPSSRLGNARKLCDIPTSEQPSDSNAPKESCRIVRDMSDGDISEEDRRKLHEDIRRCMQECCKGAGQQFDRAAP